MSNPIQSLQRIFITTDETMNSVRYMDNYNPESAVKETGFQNHV